MYRYGLHLLLFYRYVDFTSLYPWCNKATRTVVGHPQIITENFADVSTYFGLIKCTVLPPRGLFHPVLPYRTENKLMFPLCKTCADTLNQNSCTHTDEERAILGTWCHVELMKAIEKGYKVMEIHEVWHWDETTDELFSPYVNMFLKIKQEASGYPKHCVTDEQKQQYIDEYYEHEGIRLDPDNIKYNPGLRWLAKLMLNSLWGTYLSSCRKTRVSSVDRACQERGDFALLLHPSQHPHFLYLLIGKFAQRCNMTKTKMITEPNELFDLLSSKKFVVSDARLVNKDTVEVQYCNAEEFEEPDSKTNVVIAAFTTAYARLKLYELLDQLQEQVLYYDTDSVIYVHEPGKPEPPLGDYLGDLTDELDGDYITEFMAGGPKNYAYVTNQGKNVTKIRGITLDHAALKKLNPSTMRFLVQAHAKQYPKAKVTVEMPFKITRDKKQKKIFTKKMKKDYQIVYNKRVIKEDYRTVPYGY